MRTVELAEAVGVHVNTIRRMVGEREIDYTPIGGRHGFEFPDDAPEQVRAVLKMRHRERVILRRKAWAKKNRGAMA